MNQSQWRTSIDTAAKPRQDAREISAPRSGDRSLVNNEPSPFARHIEEDLDAFAF
jgi:hypothetical protein